MLQQQQQKYLENDRISSLLLKTSSNLELLVNQFNNASPESTNDPEKISSSNYREIEKMHDIEKPLKNKSVSLFNINTCSLNKNFNNFQHLLSCTKKKFDIIKQVFFLNNPNLNNYYFVFTLTEDSVGGTLHYIANNLPHKCRKDLNICKKVNYNLLLLKLSTRKKSNIFVGVIYRHPSMEFNCNY